MNRLAVIFLCAGEVLGGLTFVTGVEAAQPQRVLRVCAAPDNLPFSNWRGEGFENRLAELVAREMKATLEYVWCPPHGGPAHEIVESGLADVVMGVPPGLGRLRTTRPYYFTSYVFVYRRDAFPVRSFDDPALRIMRIGVQMAGNDFVHTLPAHALAVRGHVENIRGYAFSLERPQDNPATEMLRAVARGELDVAVAWGPVAGYFSSQQRAPLEMAPVMPERDGPGLPFVFAIAIGLRPSEHALRAEIELVLRRHSAEIDRILDEFNVPRVSPEDKVTSLAPPPV